MESKLKENAVFFRGKFVRKEPHEDFIRFYLDNYLIYADGSYKYIDLANTFDENIECMLESLDMNYIHNYNHTKTFSSDEFCALFGRTPPMMVWKDSENNFRDLNGNIISDTLGLISSIGEIMEAGQLFAGIEQSRRAENYALTKQTSWNMPPGWK